MKFFLAYFLFIFSPIAPLFMGVVLGTVSSFLGIGGGVFLVPLLPLIYPLDAYQAIILSLSFIFFTVGINTIIFHIQKKIVWKLVLKMGPLIVVGGFAGAAVASHIPDIYLRSFLVFFLLLMSYSFFKTILKNQTEKKDMKDHFLNKIPVQGVGLFAGVLSGFAGVGSGVFLNWLVLKDRSVKSDQESPTVNAMMIFVCSGVFASALWTDSLIFVGFYKTVGLTNIGLMIGGIVLGAFLGKALNAKNLHRQRIILLFGLTLSLALLVLFEILFKN
jgi:hypothetical protein